MAKQDVSLSVRRDLEAERADLTARLAELEVSSDEALAYDDNFADSGQVAAEQGENHALASSIRDQLADIEQALGKLDDGSYGRCETCGNEINPARLEAVPSARYCIKHA